MAEPKLDWQIELRPHIGQMVREGVTIDVEHPQWIVIAGVNGRAPKQRGYLAKHKGAQLMPLSTTQEDLGDFLYAKLLEAIDAKVAEQNPQPAID